jgi:hypothetical protein
VNWAIKRAMSADAAARPANCREFMEDLMGAGWRTAGGMSTTTLPQVKPAGPDDVWFLVYRDSANNLHTVKGTTESVRKNVQSGTLGDLTTILVSRTKAGQFVPLRNTPEFRDLVVQAGQVPPTSGSMSSSSLNTSRMTDTAFDPPKGNTPLRIKETPGKKSPVTNPMTERPGKPGPGSTTEYQPPSARLKVPDGPTEMYQPQVSERDEHQPLMTASLLKKKPKSKKKANSGFDWTPIILVAIIAGAIGVALVIFLKK